MDPISLIVGAGSKLLGGLFGDSSRDAASAKEYERQKEFAQSGVQWKVADARKAGISPLAALGAQTYSYAPQSVGSSDFATGVAEMGQDVSRAIDATRTQNGRTAAVAKTMEDLTVQRMGLENELLASKIAVTRQAGQPPARADVGPLEYPLPQGSWKTGNSATAEQVERDYGDIVQEGYGMWRLLTDALSNSRPYWDTWGKNALGVLNEMDRAIKYGARLPARRGRNGGGGL